MIPQTYVRFPSSITVDLRVAIGPRPRIITEGPDAEHDPVPHTFDLLPLVIMLDAQVREIAVQLPPIPGSLRIYGPEDFAAAASDLPDDHAERVLHILGSDPASVLQALIDGSDLPPLPPRVPREIPNWRAKAVLATMGQLTVVEAAIQAMPEPERTIVSLAWGGDAKLARSGKTVLMLAPMLGLSSAEVDALFIAAEAIEV
ncbi:MAG: hypothetical protein Q8Q59_06280 [Luteolibacter sp.]|jgi:hypothetical protein|nr:hypothetical protein [Luteolibacter sp.]